MAWAFWATGFGRKRRINKAGQFIHSTHVYRYLIFDRLLKPQSCYICCKRGLAKGQVKRIHLLKMTQAKFWVLVVAREMLRRLWCCLWLYAENIRTCCVDLPALISRSNWNIRCLNVFVFKFGNMRKITVKQDTYSGIHSTEQDEKPLPGVIPSQLKRISENDCVRFE